MFLSMQMRMLLGGAAVASAVFVGVCFKLSKEKTPDRVVLVEPTIRQPLPIPQSAPDASPEMMIRPAPMQVISNAIAKSTPVLEPAAPVTAPAVETAADDAPPAPKPMASEDDPYAVPDHKPFLEKRGPPPPVARPAPAKKPVPVTADAKKPTPTPDVKKIPPAPVADANKKPQPMPASSTTVTKSATTTTSAAPMPKRTDSISSLLAGKRPVYVMKDGSRIEAASTVDAGDEIIIKTPRGSMEKVKKDQIARKE